jgi:hypothetical protein
MQRLILATILGTFVCSDAAVGQTVDCPDLNALQRWAGYLSWLGFFKGLGAVIFAAGVLFVMWGSILKIIYHFRLLIEVLAYVASVVLIAGGYWVSSDYLTWTVFIGCILFMGSIFLTIFIHEIKGNDPKPIAAILMVVWGTVAIYYNMTEVGILTTLALMTLLGFSVIVSPLSYSFGWHDESAMPSGTAAALMVLGAFIVQKGLFPNAPAYVQVFAPGAFWAGTIVAFTGLLVMSCKFYRGFDGGYFPMQVITIALYLAGIAAGMILNINPLAGTAGAFLVLYMAAKPMEVPGKGLTGFGFALMCSGMIMFGAWWFAMQNLDKVKPYLTTTIG